jgi:hypothetical protein
MGASSRMGLTIYIEYNFDPSVFILEVVYSQITSLNVVAVVVLGHHILPVCKLLQLLFMGTPDRQCVQRQPTHNW